MEISAAPVISSEDGTYKIGLWTRDSCAGIGTMLTEPFTYPKSVTTTPSVSIFMPKGVPHGTSLA